MTEQQAEPSTYDDVTFVQYMVSYEAFPVHDGEWDVSKAPAVLEALLGILQREMPNLEDWYLWADHPEYTTLRDLDVRTRVPLTDDQMGDLLDALSTDFLFHWVDEAMEQAGVEFDLSNIELDESDGFPWVSRVELNEDEA